MRLNKKSVLIAILIIAAIPVLIGIVLRIDRARDRSRPQIYELTREELGSLRSGDIVLRMGYGLVSSMLENSSGGTGVSHCGILTGENPGFRVIHSISSDLADEDGVQECTLSEFVRCAKPDSFVAVRCLVADANRIVHHAGRYLEQRIPFDMIFDIGDSSKIFCSELIYLSILNASGCAIFDTEKMDYNFTSFFDRSLFQPVIDHRSERAIRNDDAFHVSQWRQTVLPGSWIINSSPPPSRFRAVILPPWTSMAFFTMDSPRPEPPLSRVRPSSIR